MWTSRVTSRVVRPGAHHRHQRDRADRLRGVAAQRRGECHSLEATARLEQLLSQPLPGAAVRARRRERLGRRLKRVVATRVRGGWRDVGRILITEGHAVWLSGGASAWNADYARRAERAAAGQLGIWNPTYCGLGPSDASPLKVTVNGSALWDEWVRVRNLDPVDPVHLGGWSVRDSALKQRVPGLGDAPAGRVAHRVRGRGHGHVDRGSSGTAASSCSTTWGRTRTATARSWSIRRAICARG